MPTRPLPKELVERLRRTAPRLERLLGKMANVDHRKRCISPADVESTGGRVRELNVRKSSPEIPIVIKRDHGSSAQETIEWVQNRVRKHNERIRMLPPAERPDYILKKPYAYAISRTLIAMAKTDAPSIAELSEKNKTERGAKMLEKLRVKHGISASQIKDSKKALWWNFSDTANPPNSQNMLLLGVEKGKLVFMPLVDVR